MPELTKIRANDISANAITADKISSAVALGGPKIANVQVANSSWTVLDDTAVDVNGGYILINGSGFVSGCQVIIGATPATSVTFANSSVLRVQVPASSAGTYVAYVINPDGGTAVGVNALTYSASPSWVTSSTLTTQQADVAISIQLSATDATTYTLQAGSSVPAGTTLASNGLFSGTVTGIQANTTYNFTVVATDAQNQDSPRTFSVTVSAVITDQYFPYTTLLLQGNGSNNATSNTFVDSSTNALTITRNGNATQGTFSPFSPTGWSNYFDGTGDYLTVPNNTNLQMGSGDFTIEFWINFSSISGYQTPFDKGYTNAGGLLFQTGLGNGRMIIYANGGAVITETGTASVGSWVHYALVRNGTTLTLYRDGTSSGSITNSTNFNNVNQLGIGATGTAPNSGAVGDYAINGHMSNLRIVKGTAVYTANFTPSTTPLTAITNTSLLTCQSNRFIDNSTNNFAITRNGDVSVQAFSPFAPAAAWSAATHGGSIYFDGTGDWIEISSPTSSLVCTGNFTLEFWAYTDLSQEFYFAGQYNNQSAIAGEWLLYADTNGTGVLYLNGDSAPRITISTAGTFKKNEWQHIAIVRSGTTVTLYVNGVSVGSTTKSDAFGRTGTSYDIGSYYTNANFAKGYMSGYRLVKGTAIYTANFTPPTAPPEAIANTSLLLNFTNAGISDATAKNVVETLGNATIRTDVKKYGAGSLYFDNNSSTYLLCKNKDMFNFLGSNFTLEFWFYRTSSGTYAGLCGSKTDYKVAISIYNGKIMYGVSSNGSSWNIMAAEGTVGSTTINNNTWYHFALVRNGSSFKGYINGQEDVSVTSSASVVNRSEEYCIGSWYAGLYPWGGYIDDFRLTMGVARYTSSFTPSTAEFATR